ncbi:FK506-binding protein 2B [Mycotypha africana]|uniref:FK506-binding protein 2B n=1 Tax=Mycotypha africana TaxID=64632 RepID=UPI0022FFD991|nr:FK506-binding protein 2B [Mycotypha africana]KAI8991089.1 FK506-binding protein 2B [Mycotypha africana]
MRFLKTSFLIISAMAAAVTALKEAPSTLQVGILKRVPPEQCKQKSSNGDQLSMNYIGTLFDTGAKFDSSYDRNEAFTFTLGRGQVIQGWDRGLVGMCVGEKRKLVIPPSMGYGERGAGNVIPPNAALVFEVQLVDIKKVSTAPTMRANQTQQDKIPSFISPSFLVISGLVVLLFYIVFKVAKRQDLEETKKITVVESSAATVDETRDTKKE